MVKPGSDPILYEPVPVGGAGGFESVRAWAADLASIPGSADDLLDMLPPDERLKAGSFRFDLHRDRFIRRRWLRRRVLADAFGVDPGAIRFRADALDWPRLVAPGPLVGLGFSSSHADGRALVAIRTGGEVGVDIARLDPAALHAASVFMSRDEHARWGTLSGHAGLAGFFRIWTRKEACLKAAGTGLARDPRTVEAWDGGAHAPADSAGHPAAAWSVLDLALEPAWAGAVAIPADPK